MSTNVPILRLKHYISTFRIFRKILCLFFHLVITGFYRMVSIYTNTKNTLKKTQDTANSGPPSRLRTITKKVATPPQIIRIAGDQNVRYKTVHTLSISGAISAGPRLGLLLFPFHQRVIFRIVRLRIISGVIHVRRIVISLNGCGDRLVGRLVRLHLEMDHVRRRVVCRFRFSYWLCFWHCDGCRGHNFSSLRGGAQKFFRADRSRCRFIFFHQFLDGTLQRRACHRVSVVVIFRYIVFSILKYKGTRNNNK